MPERPDLGRPPDRVKKTLIFARPFAIVEKIRENKALRLIIR